MYVYDDFDQTLLNERVAEFSDQIKRRVSGELSEEEFRPLRLMNGTYLQLHAYMLRISIPYGTLSSKKLRMLAHVARTYDRGYGHFTTRQNIQFHWIKLENLSNAVRDLASVGLHGATHDRAAVAMHDIGLHLKRGENGEIGFAVAVGGGLGRTPYLAELIRDFLPRRDLLAYVEAILRVYNRYGRRDNIWKARIKILVHDLGVEKFRQEVEEEFVAAKDYAPVLDEAMIGEIRERFHYPEYEKLEDNPQELQTAFRNANFRTWYFNAVAPHRAPGYAIVTISLKPVGETGGDCTADKMSTIADLADTYSFSEIRNGHE